MRVDGSLAMLDRWGRAALPGAVLLFFVLLTLAPLRAPYLSDALPLLPMWPWACCSTCCWAVPARRSA